MVTMWHLLQDKPIASQWLVEMSLDAQLMHILILIGIWERSTGIRSL